MKKYNLVWFQHDLRLDDNPALYHAACSELPIIGLFLFPNNTKMIHGMPLISNARANAIYQACESLHQALDKLGVGLVVIQSIEELSTVINLSTINSVYYNEYPGTRERKQRNLLQRYLNQSTFQSNESYSMIHPSMLGFAIKDTPDVFTTFRKQVEKHVIIKTPLLMPNITQNETRYLLPSLKSLGFDPVLLLIPSTEDDARQRLQYYCIESGRVRTYKETRNGMFEWDDSSKLSMHLSLGTLSPRRIYTVLKEAEALHGANESTYWLWFELLWRDFFYFTHLKEQQAFFQPWDFPESLAPRQQELFTAILEGRTGYPLVDANMKELTKTGWMSNRGRQNVASFFVHYCKLPWSLGATMFESYLLDYNVSSNIGNWRYVAGVGNDPRDQRIFNVIKQGAQYDASTEYLLRWLPQLKDVPLHQRYLIHTLPSQVRIKIQYPDPIIGLPWQ
jgi:deoxyribodipyrimidine photo-lyase